MKYVILFHVVFLALLLLMYFTPIKPTVQSYGGTYFTSSKTFSYFINLWLNTTLLLGIGITILSLAFNIYCYKTEQRKQQ